MGNEIEHDGTLVAVENGRGRVLISQASACAACHAKGLCTSAESSEKLIDVSLPSGADFGVGDRVTIVGSKSIGFRAVFWAFVVPFVVLISALFVAQKIISHEAISGTIALCSLVPYFGILSLFRKRLAAKLVFSIKA